MTTSNTKSKQWRLPGYALTFKDLDLTGTMTQASTSTSTGTVQSQNTAVVASGAGANVDGAIFTTTTAVALGTYANAINGKLDFGSAGRVTGLGGVICGELDLGAGTTSGSYAVFEAELNVPSGGKTGTRTSFFTLNVWGADTATFDTNGFLFDLNGVAGGTSKMFATGASIGNVDEITDGLKIQINGSTYYILLATAANFTD